MNNRLKTLGNQIKKCRSEAGLTQAELAEKLQISVVHLSNIESGKKALSIDIFIKLIEVFQVSADLLLQTSFNNNNQTHFSRLQDIMLKCSEEEKETFVTVIERIHNTYHK